MVRDFLSAVVPRAFHVEYAGDVRQRIAHLIGNLFANSLLTGDATLFAILSPEAFLEAKLTFSAYKKENGFMVVFSKFQSLYFNSANLFQSAVLTHLYQQSRNS